MQWDLVCGRRYQVGVSTSIYFSGVFLGGLIFGAISDRIGRYPVIAFTMYAQMVTGIMAYFVESFVLFNILRFITGALLQVNFIHVTSSYKLDAFNCLFCFCTAL